jgi:hypothetical protein
MSSTVQTATDIRAFHVAWEQPELFSEGVRAAFRSLRNGRSS